MLYLYAITKQAGVPLPAMPGLENRLLAAFPYRDIAAVASPVTTTGIPPTRANLWRHEAVIEALMAGRTVLPVRFGTIVSDETAVQSILADFYAAFAGDLDRVRGKVEVGLRVLWADDPSSFASRRDQRVNGQEWPAARLSPEVCGRDYLLARLEEARQQRAWRQQAETIAAAVHDRLARAAVDATRRILVTPRLLLTAAYLVERERLAAFRQEVEATGAVCPGLHFLCTGPWPPYNFVSAGASAVGG